MSSSDNRPFPLAEGHLRALERIGDPGLREAAAGSYVTAVLHPNVPAAVRGFLMALETSLPAGCEYTREDTEDCVQVTLRCPYQS